MALSLPLGLKSKVTPNRVSDSDDNQPHEDEDDGGEFISEAVYLQVFPEHSECASGPHGCQSHKLPFILSQILKK